MSLNFNEDSLEKVLVGQPKRQHNWSIILLIMFLVGGSLGLASFFSYKYYSLAHISNSPQKNNASQNVLEKLSQLMILPQDEEPTIATVSDPLVLQDKPFFSKAKKGDYVIIYPKSKKAILYDPIEEKIIDIAPVDLGSGTH